MVIICSELYKTSTHLMRPCLLNDNLYYMSLFSSDDIAEFNQFLMDCTSYQSYLCDGQGCSCLLPKTVVPCACQGNLSFWTLHKV